MKSNPFDIYTLPLGLSEGVDIALPNTKASFHVILPATMNEDFNMDLMSALNMKPNAKGEVKVDGIKFQRTRRDLFFKQCVLSADGLPDDMSIDAFFAKYPLAARYVLTKAIELSVVADEEANEALGKLENTPSSNSSGTEGSSNTTTSSPLALM